MGISRAGKRVTTAELKAAEAVISIQAKLDKANAEIERLNKTVALTSDQLRLTALCLGGE